MRRDRGPEKVRIEIEANQSVKVIFLGEERTRVISSDIYIRADIYAKALQRITELEYRLHENS